MSAAWASVHIYSQDEVAANGGVMVRSLQALRDNRDRGWQVVLFAVADNAAGHGDAKNNETTARLRISGFPGTVVQRSVPLQIQQGSQEWELPDAFRLETVPETNTDNVGEYDAGNFLSDLQRRRPITLTVSLAAGDVAIVLPPFAVKEWLQVKEQAQEQTLEQS
ncbi:MAG: DUF3122 domain-containing protein [Cyanobacteria bacterium P01_F01_bin.153]